MTRLLKGLGLGVALLCGHSSTAVYAADVFDCIASETVASRGLFTTSGGYATTGPTNFMLAECQHKGSGFYANVFGDVPMQDWAVGREIDGRFGWRGTIGGGIQNDTSVAVYRFGIGSNDPLRTTLNARTKFSYRFDVTNQFSLTPYTGLDLQQIYPIQKTDNAVFGGVVAAYNISSWAHLSLDAAAWYHMSPPYTNYEQLVFSGTTALSFDVTKNLSVGPLYTISAGGFDTPHRIKHLFGFNATAKF